MTDPYPDDEADLLPDHEADPADPEDVAPEPVFADVEEFVTLYFSQVINRQVSNSPGRGLSWDPRWWRHREVYERLTALWQAYEGAVVSDDPSAMSRWWITDVDAHLKVLLDGATGPMSHVDPDGSWNGHGPLPCVPMPHAEDSHPGEQGP